MTRVLVLNGPNLGRLGTREPGLYGSATLAELEEALRRRGAELGVEVECRQTDDGPTLVRWVREADARAIVLNPAALTHYSAELAGAVAATSAKVFEVHITNIERREPYRRRSLVTANADGTITGMGIRGYLLALEVAAEEATR